ncbi:MAG: sugar transferase [Candidatus Binatia bacterium]
MAKRVFDIAGSFLGLVLFFPVLLAVGLLIKLDSPGAIFFRQERVGRGFRPFFIYKFRTMVQDPSSQRLPLTVGNDPRITRIGHLLRKTKIDELPQLINVLKGEMSFVGPRPEVRQFVELFRSDYEEILKIRPGVTDMASLKYQDEAKLMGQFMNPEEEYVRRILPDKIRLAKEYIERSSVLFDLGLILRTLPKLLDLKLSHNETIFGENRLMIMKQSTVETPVIRIEPSSGWISLKLHELWEYRELLYFLAWRDIKVRYKQTLLGAAWAIIQPFFTMVIFSIFFGRLAQIPSDGVPYPIFSFAALVPWTFFSHSLNQASNSLVNSANLIKKVYFPRLAVPIATVFSGMVDFALAFVVLLGMMLYYGIFPTVNALWVPAFFLLAVVTSLGVGLWLSAMNVRFRDIRHTIPFLTQFWLFATPIAYPSSLLSEPWRTLYGLNPMVGVVEGFRWGLLGTNTAPGPIIVVSSVVALAILVGGAFYFRRVEKTFADVV